MKRSRNSVRPLASTALPSRSNSMMSSAVTSAGASERDIRKWSGFLGSRALTWPKPSSTPNSARMRLPITMSSIGAASLLDGGAAGVWVCACGNTDRPAQTANNTFHVAAIVTSIEVASRKDHAQDQELRSRSEEIEIDHDLKDGLKGAAQGFVAEHESVAERLVRNNALPAQQQLVGEVAADTTQQCVGNAEHRRPMQPVGQFCGEFQVGDGDRRGRVDRATDIGHRRDMGDQTEEIVTLDPGHPLPARTERAAEPELERRQHPRDETAVDPQHQTDPQANDPHAVRLRRPRGLVPGFAELMSETGMG